MDFKHFFKNTLTEKELRSNFKVINESRWWGKFKEDKTFTLEANGKTYKCCRMEEDGGPAYVLESRGGARYGLFRATEGHFHVIRMKSGKKHLIKPKGIFREVEGNLVFEMSPESAAKQRAYAASMEPHNPQEETCYAMPAQTVPGCWEVLMWEGGQWHYMSGHNGSNAEALARADADRLNAEMKLTFTQQLHNRLAKDAIMNKEAAGIAMSPGSAAQQLEGTVTEDRMTAEPGKSFANGADTFDKWIKEIERGIYTDPK